MKNPDTVAAGEEITLEELALEEADGDMQQAVEIMTDRLLENPAYVKSLLREWAKAWAYDRVHSFVALKRRIAMQARPNDARAAEALRVAVRMNALRVMDTPIFGGKRLGDATVEEMRESARRYEMLADDTRRKACWHALIADEAEKRVGVSSETPIGDILSEEVVASLKEQANA